MSHHLSVGEKKRIAIATVLSMKPAVLVLDEPTAGLDPRARRSLIELLRELPQTMIVATHDLPMVRELLPRTIVMDHGQVVADGPTERTALRPGFTVRAWAGNVGICYYSGEWEITLNFRCLWGLEPPQTPKIQKLSGYFFLIRDAPAALPREHLV